MRAFIHHALERDLPACRLAGTRQGRPLYPLLFILGKVARLANRKPIREKEDDARFRFDQQTRFFVWQLLPRKNDQRAIAVGEPRNTPWFDGCAQSRRPAVLGDGFVITPTGRGTLPMQSAPYMRCAYVYGAGKEGFFTPYTQPTVHHPESVPRCWVGVRPGDAAFLNAYMHACTRTQRQLNLSERLLESRDRIVLRRL